MSAPKSSLGPDTTPPPGLDRRFRVLPLTLWRHVPWPGGRGRDRSKSILLRHLDLDTDNWFPTRVGWLRLRPGRDLLQRRLALNGDHYETWVERFLASEDLKGATVFDVGAHVGYFSRLLAACVGTGGRVVAFEPQPDLARMLAASAALATGGGSIRCVSAAVGDARGRVVLHVSDDRGRSSLRPASDGSVHEVAEVEQLRLDDWVESSGLVPRWIKVDVEGAELSALRGATQLMARGDVCWMIEVHPSEIEKFGGSAAQLVELLRDRDYGLQELSRNGLSDLGSQLPTTATWHLVARQ